MTAPARRLGAGSRRTLRALAEVIVPRAPEAGIEVDLDGVVDFVDGIVGHMPRLLQLAFPLGLLLLELGTFVLLPSLRPFSRLPLPTRERYVRGWIRARSMLRRDLIKGVKGLCLLAFYSDRRVMAHLGYQPDEHVQLVAAERLRRHGHEL
ncbi:MAG TPA: hypothetical protein VE987_20390 [Polyangiaceae bacterium]|nr:hypothetical protein [Polyangiaceae bacterium]